MFAIILAAMLSVSNYPLNPVAQDTVSKMNLHVTTGISGQSGMISAGPEFTLKYEYLFNHPFIFRTSLEYLPGKIDALTYPNGTLNRKSISTEVIYYKSSNTLMTYIGLGTVLGMGSYDVSEKSFFTERSEPIPQEIKFGQAFGYRLLLGLRLQQKYSLEVVITEISPSFIYYNRTSTDTFSEEEFEFRANYFKISFGYLFKLK